MVVDKIRRTMIFVILAILCVYFTIGITASIKYKAQGELEKATFRIDEYFSIIVEFIEDAGEIGEEYLKVDEPNIDKNIDDIEFYDNFTYTTSDRLMSLNRRLFGRGTHFTVNRDSKYVNLAFIFDRFFRDFSTGFVNVTSIGYYSRHNFIYTYSNIGQEYLLSSKYYTQAKRYEKIITTLENSGDDLFVKTILNENYLDQHELLIGKPVYEDNSVEGLISVNFSLSIIDDIMDNNYYKTYLIDKDGNIVAANASAARVGEFDNITDKEYFGAKEGADILAYAFDDSKRDDYNTNCYNFSDVMFDDYVIFLYVPKYSYFIAIFASVMAIVVVGKIMLWLDDTYLKRSKVRQEITNKYEEVSKLKEELEKVATMDFLTKLYNRRYLLERIEEEKLTYRNNPDAEFVILMMDIDHFKNVNDTFGHSAGDEVLKNVSKVILSVVKKDDLVARWGGEEILVVLVNKDKDDGMFVAEKIRAEISETVSKTEIDDIMVTISVGVYSLKMTDNFDRALTKADEALYEAKAFGRNRVIQYDGLNL